MILLNFRDGNSLRLGILQGEHVIDVRASGERLGINAPATFKDLAACSRQGLGKLESLAAVTPESEQLPLEDLEVGPAVPHPFSGSLTSMKFYAKIIFRA